MEEDKNIAALHAAKAALGGTKYSANIICLNCGWSGAITIEKRIRIRDTMCPNCECSLGEKENLNDR